MKWNNWIEFIFGAICGMFISIITGYSIDAWQFYALAFFIAVESISYRHIKNYLEKNEK
jgi:uncharacterized membrane protein YoaK (UPF0700 family)